MILPLPIYLLFSIVYVLLFPFLFFFFFFNDTPTPEIYTFPYTTLFRSPTAAVFGRIELSVGTGLFWAAAEPKLATDRKSTRLNSSHRTISYAVFCLKKKKKKQQQRKQQQKTEYTQQR